VIHLHVTRHAVQRYCERVCAVSPTTAKRALSSTAVQAAVAFGAPFVRLPTGQRIVVREGNVVTVLQADTPRIYLRPNYER